MEEDDGVYVETVEEIERLERRLLGDYAVEDGIEP